MKLTVPVSLVLLILSGAVVFVTEAGRAQRSARWDAFLSQTRPKRSASSWQSRDTNPTCTLTGLTADDTLGRRASRLLSPPQNQGCCGNCWAFAATHTSTDHLSIRAGRLTSQLSSQHLTACITTPREPPDNGCCGDFPSNALQFFQNTGAVTENCLPYDLSEYQSDADYKEANPIQCPTSCSDGTSFQTVNLPFHGCQFYTPQQETQVIEALRTGPVIAEMFVSYRFGHYRCGVFCYDRSTDKLFTDEDGDPIGHAVEIVDYGTTNSGIDFWVAKNSWGDDEQEGGYFRIRRGDLITRFIVPASSPTNAVMCVPSANAVMACAPGTVRSPSQNILVMSAVDVAIMQLDGRIPCRDNSPATSISLTSVTSATVQVVEGFALVLNIVVNIQGCTQPTQASVEASVMSYLNGTFELTGHSYQYLDRGGAAAITSNILLLIATTVMAVLTFGCY